MARGARVAGAREYSLPIPIVLRGELVPAGATVELREDEVVRVEAAARAAGVRPAPRTETETETSA